MGVVTNTATALLDSLANPSTAGNTNEELSVAIIKLASIANFTIQLLEDIATADVDAANASKPDARDSGGAIQHIGEVLYDVIHHTYAVVIPHSQEWTYGRVIRNLIDPLRKRVGKVESSVRFLMGWRGQIDNWRHNYVDPQLQKDRAFREWFMTWPLQSIGVLHDWLTKPHAFSDFAVPRITVPLIRYLATQPERLALDTLAREIIDVSPDAFRHVEAAAVAILLTEQ